MLKGTVAVWVYFLQDIQALPATKHTKVIRVPLMAKQATINQDSNYNEMYADSRSCHFSVLEVQGIKTLHLFSFSFYLTAQIVAAKCRLSVRIKLKISYLFSCLLYPIYICTQDAINNYNNKLCPLAYYRQSLRL